MPIELKGTCQTCRLWGLQEPDVCAFFGIKRTTIDYCSEHRRTLTACSICGRPVIGNGSIIDNHLICYSCANFFDSESCKICRFGSQCAYETDPSPLEKQIQKQIKQGNFYSVVSTPNPERIRITCEKGCPCYDSKNGCLKRNNAVCGKLEVIYKDGEI